MVFLFMLSGCSSIGSGNNITGLLSSPKHSQTESLIAQEIGYYLDENITLKYSQTQGYSAPMQFIDIDDDGTEEALVFYYALNKGTNIRFALLNYADEKWNIVFDKEGLGTEVFFFDTIELQGMAGKQIIVGYLPTNISENFFVTYFTDSANPQEDYIEVCEDIFVADVTDNGYSDIVLTNKLFDNKIRVKVLTFGQDNTFKTTGTKVLKRGDVQVTQLTVAETLQGEPALYIDYADSYNKLYTEAGILQGTAIVNCLCTDTVGRSWPYAYKLNSYDIDGDGIQEIPEVSPGETEEASALKLVEWSDYLQNPQQRKLHGVYDTSENVFIALPEEWYALVKTEQSANYWQLVSAANGTVLMKISVSDHSSNTAKNDYTHNVNIGQDIWNIKFDKSVEQQQMDFVLNHITAFR